MLHLHSYAFDVLLEEMCYRGFYWKFIHYILFYSWFNTEVQFYVKSLFNWTCGLNNSSKQICLLRCFHLTLALLILGTWWLLEGKGITYTSHPHSFRSLRAWNLIIWVHLFSLLEDYSCGGCWTYFVECFHIHCWVIILLLVCLVFIDLLYVYASTMFEFIKEMLPFFLFF
jgi:hypothetical protein